jgi:preprotein translocase subunit SecF
MIEFLPSVNVDWLGKRRLFFAISAALILSGMISILNQGSLRYGVDFQGGTIVYLRFQERPPIDRVRSLLADAGLANSQIQEMGGAPAPGQDVLIQLEQTAAPEADLTSGREKITTALNQEFQGRFEILNSESVGPKAGSDLRRQAVLATAYALGGILIYMAFRFEWIYGAAAVFAVFHDVLVVLGLFSITNRQIDLTVVAALLTLVGYQVNDTIVVFDRIRENLRMGRREPLEKSLNDGINQTMGRTIITAGLTTLAILALFLFGGDALNNFAFALLCGQVIGTYSSIAIAAPLVLIYSKVRGASAMPVPAKRSGVAKVVRPAKAK